MNALAMQTTQEIVAEQVFPHAPEKVWKALTDADAVSRWLMQPEGFAPVVGNRFTFKTTAAGQWDGTIQCEVLEVVPHERFVYAWRGGHESNVGYGSKLDTKVTFTLSKEGSGTRVRVVHSGFEMPRNETAYKNMSGGWSHVIERLGKLAGDN
jgi:uncharacterized protein YndB with AHSA1/START domain